MTQNPALRGDLPGNITMNANQEMMRRDLSVLWHPCSQMKDHEQLPLIPIKRGKGVWLYDFEGNRYLDAISSWWVNLFGHGNDYINTAITRQLSELEHVILAGFSHEPVIRLSERLLSLAPAGLSRCFYADNGSSAVEVALKMSYHYWLNCGHGQKTRFATLSNSYHGETLGALAVGDVSLYKQTYRPLLMDVLTLPLPDLFNKPQHESDNDYVDRLYPQTEALLQQHAQQLAAVIVEPLVQCAGNMRMYPAHFLKRLRQSCDALGIHLIADEIAVGFGRTGTLFACEQAGISPDFMCLSKGLTGGYLPLSVVLCGEDIYQAFYDDYEKLTAFLHSHSYTGNALACAAANASLDLFEKGQVLQRNQELSHYLQQALQGLSQHPHIGDVRQRGMIAAVEMLQNKAQRQAYPWQQRRGLQVYRHALQRGVLLRPLGNVIYFMPPYVISEEQIDLMVQVATEGIELATA